jgi:hypothetical protein
MRTVPVRGENRCAGLGDAAASPAAISPLVAAVFPAPGLRRVRGQDEHLATKERIGGHVSARPGRCGWSPGRAPGAKSGRGQMIWRQPQAQPQVCARSAETILIWRMVHATIRCHGPQSSPRALPRGVSPTSGRSRSPTSWPDSAAWRRRPRRAAPFHAKPSTPSAARPTTTAALPTPLPFYRRTTDQAHHLPRAPSGLSLDPGGA